ncbi:MAG: transposase, partial [Pseudonocardiaceae bacterium]
LLTFFAQDSGTHNLIYANAELTKASQAREVIAFCDHWKQASGADPAMLIMDQKVTTQPVLAELNTRGIKFLTLRMRSPALVKQINALAPADYKTITLNRPGRHNRPRVHESRTRLTGYDGTVRQLVVTGLGREAPTVIITNNDELSIKALIEHYARRMTIEERLAEIIGAFHADALSSTVNLNVDLDITLCVLAQALIAALRARLPGYAAVSPDVIQRRFLETPGTITTTRDTITVRLDRRAYSPVLRTAALPNDTVVPWWDNRTLHYEIR